MTQTICIIDDEIIHINRMRSIIPDSYELITFTNPLEFLQSLNDDPDFPLLSLVFLDVSMPEMNGLDVLKSIRTDSHQSSVPVVIVSSKSEFKDIIAGYEAGADDYITKDLNKSTIELKIKKIIELQTRIESAVSEKNSISQFAHDLMTNTAEMGEVVRFSQSMDKITDLDELAQSVVTICEQFGLTVITYINAAEQQVFKSNKAAVKLIEKEIIRELANSEHRIYSFSDRSFLNAGLMSLLILNMPLSDPDKAGRLRDHLSFVVQAAESRANHILLQSESSRKSAMIQAMIKDVDDLLAPFESIQTSFTQIMDSLVDDVDMAFVTLGLTEEQESRLINIVRNKEKLAAKLLEDSETVATQLRKIATI